MRSSVALVFILILTASSIMMVKPAWAQNKPSVPEFTLQFEAHPYYVPPTFGINQYTGKNITIQEGFHVENKTVIVTIKNQPFASNYHLFYNIRYKGHFGSSWTELYSYSRYSSGNLLYASDSQYTAVSIPPAYPAGAQVDFQVEAMLWHYTQVYSPSISGSGNYEERFTIYETSSWSNTQTITIPENTPSPSATEEPTPSTTPQNTPTITTTITPTPTPTPTQEQTAAPTPNPTQQPTDLLETAIPMKYVLVIIAVIVIALVAGIGIGFMVKSRKNSKSQT